MTFAIIGTGRSGTGYISQLLSTLGIPCGHEEVFTPAGPVNPARPVQGDASWLAVPVLEKAAADTELALQVVHLVRDPLAVVNSLVGIKFFDDPVHGAYQDFAFEHEPSLRRRESNVKNAMRWYVNWNRRCEPLADGFFHLEDLRTPDVVAEMIDVLDVAEQSTERINAALLLADTNYNHRARATLTWNDLPSGALYDELARISEDYGYLL